MKRFLLFFLVLTCAVTSAWADVELKSGNIYTIRLYGTENYLTTAEVADNANSTYSIQSESEKFVLEGSEGAWTLKSDSTDMYVGYGVVNNWDVSDHASTWNITAVSGYEDTFTIFKNASQGLGVDKVTAGSGVFTDKGMTAVEYRWVLTLVKEAAASTTYTINYVNKDATDNILFSYTKNVTDGTVPTAEGKNWFGWSQKSQTVDGTTITVPMENLIGDNKFRVYTKAADDTKCYMKLAEPASTSVTPLTLSDQDGASVFAFTPQGADANGAQWSLQDINTTKFLGANMWNSTVADEAYHWTVILADESAVYFYQPGTDRGSGYIGLEKNTDSPSTSYTRIYTNKTYDGASPAGSGGDSTDKNAALKFFLEFYEAPAVDYTVVITTNGAEYCGVTYGDKNYKDGETISAKTLTAAELTPVRTPFYNGTVAIDGTNINVTYTNIGIEKGKYYRFQNAGKKDKYLTIESTGVYGREKDAKNIGQVITFMPRYNRGDFEGKYAICAQGVQISNVSDIYDHAQVTQEGGQYYLIPGTDAVNATDNAAGLLTSAGFAFDCVKETADKQGNGSRALYYNENASYQDKVSTWAPLRDNGVNEHPQSYWIPEEVESVEVALNEVDGKFYATTCLPFNAKAAAGTSAYFIDRRLNADYLSIDERGVVEAGDGVLLIGTSNTATLTITKELPTVSNGNFLTGTMLGTTITSADYVLGKYEGVAGFWHTSNTTLGANKAYIPAANLPAASNGMAISFGEVTAIANVETEGSAVVYDLQGRRVIAPVSGQLYIVNGKKYIQK